jgi:hypothetical protein
MYNPSIYLEGLRISTRSVSQDIRPSDRDLNQGPPECEAGVLTIRPTCSVFCNSLLMLKRHKVSKVYCLQYTRCDQLAIWGGD